MGVPRRHLTRAHLPTMLLLPSILLLIPAVVVGQTQEDVNALRAQGFTDDQIRGFFAQQQQQQQGQQQQFRQPPHQQFQQPQRQFQQQPQAPVPQRQQPQQ